MTEAQVRRLLELDTRFQVHALLKEHHVPLQYTTADLADDLAADEQGYEIPRAEVQMARLLDGPRGSD